MDATENTLRDEEPVSLAPSQALLAGRYRVRGILGRGGMGTVYRAGDLELGEVIALKIVAKGTSSQEGLERQREEVKLARRVTHPNVARTFDIGEHEGLRFITMELVDGTSLRDIIGGDTPLDHRLTLIAHIAGGLAAIHEAGIAHRDLKPENVLVSSAGVAKITDFGIARDADCVTDGMTTGTPRYMAPEVLAGGAPTPAADVYAFGLVAYETICGDRFLGGDPRGAEHVLRGILGPSHADVTSFIRSCLAENPAARPRSVKPLEALLAREAVSAPFVVDLALAPRARLAACVFASDAADAWLSDSVPAEILRSLATYEGLEVVTTPLDANDLESAAKSSAIDVVMLGSIRRDGESVHVSVRAVSTDDQLQLWARSTTLTMESLPAGLREIGRLVAAAVLDQERTQRTMREQDPRVTELVLRASHEDHDPWRDFNSQAATLLEQAHTLAPDDPMVLASLAQALIRGASSYDGDRYHRARQAAERAVELDGASPECQLALAATLFVGNDALGAITSLRSVLRDAPSVPDAHGILAAVAVDVGLFRDGVGRASLAMALEPTLAIARVVAALAHEYGGDPSAADALIDGGLSSDAPLARVLAAMTGARFAIWRGTTAAVEQLVQRFAPLRGMPFIEPLVAGLERTLTPAEAIASMGPLSGVSPEWARQRCMRLQLEVELLVHRGDLLAAAQLLEPIVAGGSYDASWFTKCPAVRKIASGADITSCVDRVAQRAEAVRRALASAGLMGSPRRRATR